MLDFESCKKVHAGNGLTREWSYDFPLPDVSYMKVYVSGPGGAPELISSGYRVDAEARRVVYPVSTDADALPAGWTLTLMRELPLLQPVKLLNQQGRFFADDTEKGLDRGVMMIQQLAEELSRCVKLPVYGGMSSDDFIGQLRELFSQFSPEWVLDLYTKAAAQEQEALRLYNSIFYDIVGPDAEHMNDAVQLVCATAAQMI